MPAGGIRLRRDSWNMTAVTWLTDKTQVLYFSSRFLIRKNKTSLAALSILRL